MRYATIEMRKQFCSSKSTKHLSSFLRRKHEGYSHRLPIECSENDDAPLDVPCSLSLSSLDGPNKNEPEEVKTFNTSLFAFYCG